MAQVHIELRHDRSPLIRVNGDHLPAADVHALGVNFTEGEDPTLTLVRVKRPDVTVIEGEMSVTDMSVASLVRTMDYREVHKEAMELVDPFDEWNVGHVLEAVARRLEGLG